MDVIRMARIFSNNEKLSEKLLFELNNYKFFTESTVPNIAVLCSEEVLKNEISNIYDKAQSDYIMDTFSTAQGTEGILEKIMNTDAVILYTNALKIAPKLLYDICSPLSITGKKIYVLLGGWNQLPKETTLIKRKLVQVAKEFSKNDIVMVKGIYEGDSVEGLENLANAFKAVLRAIKNNFKEYRYKQEEALYSLHKKAVNAEINEIQKSIERAKEKVLGFLDYIYKKQLGYGLVFKNANIVLTDITGELKDKLDGLTAGEFIDYLQESCEENDLNNINRVVEKLKEKMIAEVAQFVEVINESPKTDVNIKVDTFIQECVNEMQYVITELGKLNHVNSDLFKELAAVTQEVTSLTGLQNKVKDEFKESMSNVADKLKGCISSIQLNTKKFTYWDAAGKAVDGLETAREFIDKVKGKEETEKHAQNKDGDDSEETRETINTTRLERKITGAKNNVIEEIVKELMESTKLSVLVYMDSIMQAAKNGIQKQSKYYVNQYFQRIILGINKISDDLTAQKRMIKYID